MVRFTLLVVLLAGCPGDHFTNVDARLDDGATIDGGTDGGAVDGPGPDAEPGPPTTYRLTASDGGTDDRFGVVAISGDTIAVGAQLDDDTQTDSGAVYVFDWDPDTMGWTQTVKLKASDPIASARFGAAVDLAGDTLVVGAPGVTMGAGVYVFERNGSGSWIQAPKLTSGANYDSFGSAVAINGTILVVGAPGDDQVQPQAGALFLYNRGASAFEFDEKLVDTASLQDDQLGASVAFTGTRIAAGAPGVDITAGFNEGAAYVFEAAGATWFEKPRVSFAVSTGSLGFGTSVGLAGDVLVVGVHRADRFGQPTGDDSGAVDVWIRNVSNGVWEHSETLLASDMAAGARFGNAVALQGSVLLVGAPFASSSAGKGYRFDRGTGFTESAILTTPDATAGEQLGGSVDISGDRLAIGSMLDASSTGAAYVIMR